MMASRFLHSANTLNMMSRFTDVGPNLQSNLEEAKLDEFAQQALNHDFDEGDKIAERFNEVLKSMQNSQSDFKQVKEVKQGSFKNLLGKVGASDKKQELAKVTLQRFMPSKFKKEIIDKIQKSEENFKGLDKNS
jgi:hypothetical protein